MLSNEREILRAGQVTTAKAGMVEAFGSLGPARIAIEVGTRNLSPTRTDIAPTIAHNAKPNNL
jgi:hypothetical protein